MTSDAPVFSRCPMDVEKSSEINDGQPAAISDRAVWIGAKL